MIQRVYIKLVFNENNISIASALQPTFNVAENASPSAQICHIGINCNECGSDVIGYRYKCLQCIQYNLCMHCEYKMFHNSHRMVRIADSEIMEKGKGFGSRASAMYERCKKIFT